MPSPISLLRETPRDKAADPRREGDEGKTVTASRFFLLWEGINWGSSFRIVIMLCA